jgi:signal transduction histidine kinase
MTMPLKHFIAILLFYALPAQAQYFDVCTLLNKSDAAQVLLVPASGNYVLPSDTQNLSQCRQSLQRESATGSQKSIRKAAVACGWLELAAARGPEAAKLFDEALEISLKLDDKHGITDDLIACGLAYEASGKNDDALDYFERASVFAENLERSAVVAFLTAKAAQCKELKGNYDQASEGFRRAAKTYAGLGMRTAAAACHVLDAENALQQGDAAAAEIGVKNAFSVLQNSRPQRLTALLYRTSGLVDFRRGLFEPAVIDFDKSLALHNDLLVQKLRKDAYMQLFTLHSLKGETAKADGYHEKYRTLKDSLRRVVQSALGEISDEREKTRIVRMLRKQGDLSELNDSEETVLELGKLITEADLELLRKEQDLETKTAEIEQLNREKMLRDRDFARKELQLNRQRAFKNLAILIGLAALIFAVLIYNRYIFGKRTRQALREERDEANRARQELEVAQNQLIQSEKMAALGQLTAGIAHEIQNPLNFVNNFAEGSNELLHELEQESDDTARKELISELRESMGRIREHGKRAERIVRSMLQHSRSGNGEFSEANLNQLLHEAVNLAYHGMRATYKDFQCTVEEDLLETLPPLKVVQEEINRVFLNISNNAFYALRQYGLTHSEHKACLKVSTSVYGDHVIVRIRDNGPGIPPAVAEKIFQPFFTTKPSGQGTGLGLSMSFDIVGRHNGKITLDSHPGEYTEFVIALPLRHEQPATA